MRRTRKLPLTSLLITQQKYTNNDNEVQFGESCGYSGGMAPALKLGTTLGHGYSLQAVMLFPGSVPQHHFEYCNLLLRDMNGALLLS